MEQSVLRSCSCSLVLGPYFTSPPVKFFKKMLLQQGEKHSPISPSLCDYPPLANNSLFYQLFISRPCTHTHSIASKQAISLPEALKQRKLKMALSVFLLYLTLHVCSLWEQHLTETKDTCKYTGQRTEDFFSFSASRAFCWCKAAGILLHVTAVARLPCLLAWVGANVYSTSACS